MAVILGISRARFDPTLIRNGGVEPKQPGSRLYGPRLCRMYAGRGSYFVGAQYQGRGTRSLPFRNSSGSLAIFGAIRRASSLLRSFAADSPAGRSFKRPCPHCQNLRGASKFARSGGGRREESTL
jgi:hypothetical protein